MGIQIIPSQPYAPFSLIKLIIVASLLSLSPPALSSAQEISPKKRTNLTAGPTPSLPPLAYPLRFMLHEKLVIGELDLGLRTQARILDATQAYLQESMDRRAKLQEEIRIAAARGAKESQAQRDQLAKQFQQTERREIGKLNRVLNDLLTVAQRNRLREINQQLIGLDGILHPELSVPLDLKDEQLDTIIQQRLTLRNEAVAIQKASPADAGNPQVKALLESIRADHHHQVFTVLTEDQQRKYRELCGAKINFDRTDLKLQLSVKK